MFPQYYFISPTYLYVYELDIKLNYFLFKKYQRIRNLSALLGQSC